MSHKAAKKLHSSKLFWLYCEFGVIFQNAIIPPPTVVSQWINQPLVVVAVMEVIEYAV